MNRAILLRLLEAAKHRLAEIEARIRHENDVEQRSPLDTLQQKRVRAILYVEHIQDELASSPPDEAD
jgi:hypothetical protein